MGEVSKIQWTHATFNPWWGCTRVSPGCEHCYAEAFDKRVGGEHWGPQNERRFFGDKHWNEPKKWNAEAERAGERRRVFCASMADVFEDRADLVDQRARLWTLIRETPWLDWLLLTKRPENFGRFLPPEWGEGWPNVWLGTTVEDRRRADERLPHLRRAKARVRFLSCEPLLEDLGKLDLKGISWIIVGGESGGVARRFDVAWARSLIRQCGAAKIACFIKQLGAFVVDRNDAGFDAECETWAEGPDAGQPTNPRAWPDPARGVEHDIDGYREEYQGAPVRVRLKDWKKGGDPEEWPLDLRVREFPTPR